MSRTNALTMFGIAAGVLISAGFAFGWVRMRSLQRPAESLAYTAVMASGAAPTTSSEVAAPPTASETPEQPVFVLVWIETVPPGATIRRMSDRAVLGRTPETVEFRRSDQPERIRLELQDYLSEERDVPTSQDSRIAVRLKPTTGKHVSIPRSKVP